MKEHILSFSVGFDDDAIIKTVEETGVKLIINDIKKDLIDKIFIRDNGYYSARSASSMDAYGNIVIDKNAELSSFARRIIEEAIEEHKDEIFERAAKELADSYKRTKAWRDLASDKLKEEKHD